MAAALVKKVLCRSIGGKKVLDLGGVKFFSKKKGLAEEAHRGRHRCMKHTPTEENPSNKGSWTFHSAKGLSDHITVVHKISGEGKFCRYCGNLKGMEDQCNFLSPYHHPCPAVAKPKMSKAQVDQILIQQLRDKKKD